MDQNLKIQKTADYAMFNTLKANRMVNKNHVRKLKTSLGERQIPVPIIVNEKMEVIDGQHRLEALKSMDAEVYYLVINGLTLQDVIRLNHDQKNWALRDYIEAYVEEGNKNYETILDWDTRYVKLNLNKIISILQDKPYVGHHKNFVERGEWEIPAGLDMERARKLASELDQLHEATRPLFSEKTKDWNAMFYLAAKEDGTIVRIIDTLERLKELKEYEENGLANKATKSIDRFTSAFKETTSQEAIMKKVARWLTDAVKLTTPVN